MSSCAQELPATGPETPRGRGAPLGVSLAAEDGGSKQGPPHEPGLIDVEPCICLAAAELVAQSVVRPRIGSSPAQGRFQLYADDPQRSVQISSILRPSHFRVAEMNYNKDSLALCLARASC